MAIARPRGASTSGSVTVWRLEDRRGDEGTVAGRLPESEPAVADPLVRGLPQRKGEQALEDRRAASDVVSERGGVGK